MTANICSEFKLHCFISSCISWESNTWPCSCDFGVCVFVSHLSALERAVHTAHLDVPMFGSRDDLDPFKVAAQNDDVTAGGVRLSHTDETWCHDVTSAPHTHSRTHTHTHRVWHWWRVFTVNGRLLTLPTEKQLSPGLTAPVSTWWRFMVLGTQEFQHEPLKQTENQRLRWNSQTHLSSLTFITSN